MSKIMNPKLQIMFQSEQQVDSPVEDTTSSMDNEEMNLNISSTKTHDGLETDLESAYRLEDKEIKDPVQEVDNSPLLVERQLSDKEYRVSTPKQSENDAQLLRHEAPSFCMPPQLELGPSKRQVNPDLTWLQTENDENESNGIPPHAAPPPPSLWASSSNNLPTGWRMKGGSLPCNILQAALSAAAQRMEYQTIKEPIPPPTPSVIKPTPSNIKKTTTKLAPNDMNLWPKTDVIEYADESQIRDEIEVLHVKATKPTPGIGKERPNPVKPSSMTIGSCTDNVIESSQEEVVGSKSSREEGVYQCDQCRFETEWAGSLMHHKMKTHDLQIPAGPSEKMIYILMDQNEAIIQRMNKLKFNSAQLRFLQLSLQPPLIPPLQLL